MHIEKANTTMNIDPDSEEVESEDHYDIKNLPESYLKTLKAALYDRPTSEDGVEEMREEIEEALKDPEERLKESMNDDRSFEEQLDDMQGDSDEN